MSGEKELLRAIFLAAGWGTRLGEFGESLPKGLIQTGDKTIIDRLMTDVKSVPGIGQKAIVSNGRFYDQYRNWLVEAGLENEVTLISNDVFRPEDRLGAIGDLVLVLNTLNWGNKDVLVLPSDTLYGFKLAELVGFFHNHPEAELVTVVREMGKEEIKGRLGCAVLEGDRIVAFEEKPEIPPSQFAAIPFYVYRPPGLARVKEYRQLNDNPQNKHLLDAPGKIIPWLVEQGALVLAFKTSGQTLDVGTLPDVEAAKIYVSTAA